MTLPLIKQILDRLVAIEGASDASCVLSSDYTLTSATASQKLFDASANGAVTLVSGFYTFRAVLLVDSMSVTSGNAAFDLKGAGTATINNILYQATGKDSAVAANPNALSGSTSVTSLSAGSIVVAAVNGSLDVVITGTFRVTNTGTVIPSIALVTAAAAVVKAGSHFTVKRLGPITSNTVGNWT